MDSQKLKALIIGSTGGIGRELVKELLKSSKWSEVHVIVRKELEEWKNLNVEERNKLKVLKLDNLDSLKESDNFSKFKGLNSVFCCLGAVQKNGKENFIKVDKTYPLYTADIALKNNIPQYHIVTAQMADKNSMFLYMKVKGEVESMLTQKNFNYLGIYRPGLLLNREEPRLIERVLSYIPFLSKADVKDIAYVMRLQAENNASVLPNAHTTQIFDNSEINKIASYKH